VNPTLSRVVALLGLASLGEGLFILARVVPHESVLLGAGLAAAGALALAFARPPRVARLPALPVAACGLVAALGVLAYDALRHAALDPPKVALVALGLALVAVSPFLARPRVANATAWGAALVGAPLAVWALQALAKAEVAGMTPMELFIRWALLAPMAAALGALGRHPAIAGQVITYQTPHGPFSLEVGVACSGIQAMALFMGVIGVFVVAEKPGWRRGLLWGVVGIAGVYAVNVVRLVVLALVGSRWGADALEWVHANLGWMFFVAWSACFAWLTMGGRRTEAGTRARPP
jgi:exosortase/archaeosortase family protein